MKNDFAVTTTITATKNDDSSSCLLLGYHSPCGIINERSKPNNPLNSSNSYEMPALKLYTHTHTHNEKEKWVFIYLCHLWKGRVRDEDEIGATMNMYGHEAG